MQKILSKTMMVGLAICLTFVMVSSALAVNQETRSAEMVAHSLCYRAGTFTMIFGQQGWSDIAAEIAASNYAEIRVALNGTDLPFDCRDVPLLCRDIKGTVVDALVPHSGELILLDTLSVEVSEIEDAGTADFTVYVWAEDGGQIIHVYIRALNPNITGAGDVVWSDVNTWPWIKVGLHDEVDPSTAICADVHCFDEVSNLTISVESEPDTLNFTGQFEIGHFVSEIAFSCRDCVKDEESYCSGTELSQIEVCPLDEQATCQVYYKCAVIEGTWPSGEDVVFEFRVNGAQDGDTTQQYVGLRSITLIDTATGAPIAATWTYYDADGTVAAPTPCNYDIWKMTTTVNEGMFDNVQVCTAWEADMDQSATLVGTNFRLWGYGFVDPCSEVFSCMMTGPAFVACETGPSAVGYCFYHPYVVQNLAPWFTGVTFAITDGTDPANVQLCWVLTDNANVQHTYLIDGLGSANEAWSVDAMLSNFDGGSIAPGACFLRGMANCRGDSFLFITDTVWGASVLCRNHDCCSVSCSDWSTWCD